MATTADTSRIDDEPRARRDGAPRPTPMIDHPVLAVATVEGGRISASNRAWKRLFAMPDDVSVESHVAALFPNAQGADRFEKALAARLVRPTGSESAHALGEQTLTRRDSTTFRAEVMVWPTAAFDGNHLLSADAMWQVRDLSEERTLRQDLRGLEDYYRELTRHQRDLTFVIDRKGRLSYVSSSVEAVLGHRVEALLGESFAKLFDTGQRVDAGRWLRAASRESRAATGTGTGTGTVEPYLLHVIAKDGNKRVLACRPRNCFGMPRIAGMIVHALDVTDASTEVPGVLTSAATAGSSGRLHEPDADPLTGLIGRVAAVSRVSERVAAAIAANEALAALVVDLDRLRDVNDRYGHAVGDAVIVRAARILASVAGDEDVVARIGDDQFLLVLREPAAGALDSTVQELLERLAAADESGALPRVEASIGVARLANDRTGDDSLWRRADLAAREAKVRGRGQVVMFQPRLAAAVAARKVLGDEIERAMEQRQFVLFYQPQVALVTGRMVGFEAFLRWHHPTRGLLLPDVFLAAANERGLNEALTRTVFAQVCDQVVLWQQVEDFPDVPVSINVSGQQFNDRRLPAIVASALMRSGLPARALVLEVIEQNFLFDAMAMERVVGELTRLGVRISIGSFGLGHVSLRSARQLGVAQIKLNRDLVQGLPDDAESGVVIKAAIEIAQRLKCQVVAEGVETRAQFEGLRAFGCEAAQGFYFGAPLAADEILSVVAANREHPVR